MLLTKCSYLKVAELQEAEKEIIKRVQQMSFPDVMEVLSSTESCDASGCVRRAVRKAGTSLHQLNPQLKEVLLRVGGRLASVPVHYERKHPISLPHKHHVTDLIIKQYHGSLGGTRMCSVVFKRDILASQREVSSTTSVKKMCGLSAKKGVPRRPVYESKCFLKCL